MAAMFPSGRTTRSLHRRLKYPRSPRPRRGGDGRKEDPTRATGSETATACADDSDPRSAAYAAGGRHRRWCASARPTAPRLPAHPHPSQASSPEEAVAMREHQWAEPLRQFTAMVEAETGCFLVASCVQSSDLREMPKHAGAKVEIFFPRFAGGLDADDGQRMPRLRGEVARRRRGGACREAAAQIVAKLQKSEP
jgi:hypothetical protein